MSATYETSNQSAERVVENYLAHSHPVVLVYEEILNKDIGQIGETYVVSDLDIVQAHERLAGLIEEGKVDVSAPRWPGDVHYAILEGPWQDALDEDYLKELLKPTKKKKKTGSSK